MTVLRLECGRPDAEKNRGGGQSGLLPEEMAKETLAPGQAEPGEDRFNDPRWLCG